MPARTSRLYYTSTRPPIRWRWPAFFALLLGAALGAGAVLLSVWADRTPADPHDAPAFGAPQSTDGELVRGNGGFRFVTWNVHQYAGPDGEGNAEETGRILNDSGFDVATLQEAADDEGGFALDTLTGAAGAFIGTEKRFGRVHIGNALLSRLATGPVHRIPLPDSRGKAFRTASLTTVFVPTETNPDGEPVRVIGVHLANTADGDVQTERVVDLFLATQPPCILAGDFNQTIDSPSLALLFAAEDVSDALADLPAGQRGIDHVFIRGLTASAPAVVPTDASDHPLLRVDLSLPDVNPLAAK